MIKKRELLRSLCCAMTLDLLCFSAWSAKQIFFWVKSNSKYIHTYLNILTKIKIAIYQLLSTSFSVTVQEACSE